MQYNEANAGPCPCPSIFCRHNSSTSRHILLRDDVNVLTSARIDTIILARAFAYNRTCVHSVNYSWMKSFCCVCVRVPERNRAKESKNERETKRAGSQIKLITVRAICGACIFITQCVSNTWTKKKMKNNIKHKQQIRALHTRTTHSLRSMNLRITHDVEEICFWLLGKNVELWTAKRKTKIKWW